MIHLSAAYLTPEAFSVNLLECMKNDWKLTSESLFKLLPSIEQLSSSILRTGIAVNFKQELVKDVSPLQTITPAYLKLANEAKDRRKPGDPWPVIIIDEANRLSRWKDNEALEQLLAFFVYLTKEAQLAHGEPSRLAEALARNVLTRASIAVILASSDTFHVQWLEKGASAQIACLVICSLPSVV